MIASLAAAIASAAIAAVGLAQEQWRASAAYRAARLAAWLGLDDAERRAIADAEAAELAGDAELATEQPGESGLAE